MGLKQIKVELLDFWPKESADRDIALAAWASSFDREKAETRSDDDIFRVVKQIIQNAHDTPKESVWMKFFISAPIFLERQWDKYRMSVQAQNFQIEWYEAPFGRFGITQNELSGRYRTIPDRPYILPADVVKIINEVEASIPLGYRGRGIVEQYNDMMEEEHKLYQSLLEEFPAEWKKAGHSRNADYKRCREVFRGILGTGFITDMRIVMNLNAFEHIVNQRLARDAQLEGRVAAYWLIREALNKEVTQTAIQNLVTKNGWLPLMAEIEDFLKKEV